MNSVTFDRTYQHNLGACAHIRYAEPYGLSLVTEQMRSRRRPASSAFAADEPRQRRQRTRYALLPLVQVRR